MNLNKFVQYWSTLMANKVTPFGSRKNPELPKIEWFPVGDTAVNEPLRDKEIHDLVAQIVLLGKKRGRPSKPEEADQDAA